MESAAGPTRQSLRARLAAEAKKLDFFAAVRRLECATAGEKPEGERIGLSERPAWDPVRFCQTPELYFAPNAVERYVPAGENRPPRLFVNFMGFLGPNGPMPVHLSEYIHDREHNAADSTPVRFLDLFNNRMVGMFYRAWAVNHMAVSKDAGADDSYARFVGSLFGMGMKSFRRRDPVPDDSKLFFAGHLSGPVRHPEGLESILSTFFGIPAAVREFVGNWMSIPEEFRLKLGKEPDNCTLGRSAVLGSRLWDCTHKFHVALGPMSFADYDRLLPGSGSARRLVHWIRNYVTEELIWDARLTLAKEEVPCVELGKVGRLGWTTWLLSDKRTADAADLVFGPEAATPPLREDPAAAGEVTRAYAQLAAGKGAEEKSEPEGQEEPAEPVLEPLKPEVASEDDDVHEVMGSDLPSEIESEVREFFRRIAAAEAGAGSGT